MPYLDKKRPYSKVCVATMTWLTVMEYLSQMTTDLFHFVVSIHRSIPHSRLITGFVTRLTRWVPLVEQELPTLPEHPSSSPVFSEVRVTRSLVFLPLCCLFFDIQILIRILYLQRKMVKCLKQFELRAYSVL